MPNDWKYTNGQHTLTDNNDIDLDTGVTSVVWRTLMAPYGYINGEYWGNRLWTEGRRLNLSQESEIEIKNYCLEALEELIDGDFISNVSIVVSVSLNQGTAKILCKFTDRYTGKETPLSFDWNG